jgi:hypothetical protein
MNLGGTLNSVLGRVPWILYNCHYVKIHNNSYMFWISQIIQTLKRLKYIADNTTRNIIKAGPPPTTLPLFSD